MKLSISLLALAVSAAASPLTGRQDQVIPSDDGAAPTNPTNPDNPDEPDPKDGGVADHPVTPPASTDPLATKQGLCNNWDLTTAEGVDRVWEDTSAGVTVELFIKTSKLSYPDVIADTLRLRIRRTAKVQKLTVPVEQAARVVGLRTWRIRSEAVARGSLERLAAALLAPSVTLWTT